MAPAAAAGRALAIPIGARKPRLADCVDFSFDVTFDAANGECGAVDQDR